MTHKETIQRKAEALRKKADNHLNDALSAANARADFWRQRAAAVVAQARATAELKAALWRSKAENSVTCEQSLLWSRKAEAAIDLAVKTAEIQADAMRAKADAHVVRARAVAQAQAASYWLNKADALLVEAAEIPAPKTEDEQYLAFKEVLVDALAEYFSLSSSRTEWRGTVSKVIQMLHMNPAHEPVIRVIRLERALKFLEHAAQESLCRAEPGVLGSRIWVFSRFGPSVDFVTSHEKA